MLNRLSIRNAKRSIKDYLVYIVTMTMISSLMFAFNSMIFSSSVKAILNNVTSMVIFLGLASFFVVMILVWLTNYIINFMLEKRSKEFGTYLLIGMNKKQVAKMFKREHILLGMFTFALGIVPGYIMQVALTNLFFSIFNSHYHYIADVSIFTYLLTLAYFVGAYFLALLKIKKKFKKMEIYDLLYMENKNEKINIETNTKRKSIFFISVIYILFFHVIVFTGNADLNSMLILILGLFLAIYGIFIGLSSYLVSYIQKKKNLVHKKANLFILRQLASKVKTMRFTMGTLTILFIVTMISWMIVLMFTDYQNKAMDGILMPIDILYFGDQPNKGYSNEVNMIEQYGTIEESYDYQIYEIGSNDVNTFLYANVKGAFAGLSGDSYFGEDTFMLLSDYNQLRKMSGLEAVRLNAGEYLIQCKERLKDTFEDYGLHHTFVIGENSLVFQSIVTIPFTQVGINGADYLIIVPDQYLEYLHPYFSVLAVNVTSDDLYGIDKVLKDSSGYYDEEDVFDGYLMDISYGSGSDQLISFGDPIIVRDCLVMDLDSVLTGISFMLGYIGVVFLIAAMSILAIQQLSDASKYKYRYKILKNLGMNNKERNQVVLKQLGIYYLCPVITAIIISMFTGIFVSSNFVFFTGLKVIGIQFYIMAVLIFIALFLVYFMITYSSFIRTIER